MYACIHGAYYFSRRRGDCNYEVTSIYEPLIKGILIKTRPTCKLAILIRIINSLVIEEGSA